MKRPLHIRKLEAESRANCFLASANEAEERGDHERASRLWAKCQFWLDRMNLLSNDGDHAPR